MTSSLSPADFASGAPAAGGRRRHSRRGGDVAPPPASITQAAGELVTAGAPATLEGGRKRATKAKRVAKALLKLSKKLGGRRRRH